MAIIINEGSYASPESLGSGRSNGRYGAGALLTFADAIDLGVIFLTGQGKEAPQETIRRAIQEAYFDIISAYDWPSLEGPGRISLHQAQSTGTVSYDSTTRYLTLSGAEWPTWIENASVLLNGIVCEIEAYVSSTVIVLHQSLNPGADLAAGFAYSLFCRWYPLPEGFVNFTGPMDQTGWAHGRQISMTGMAAYQRNQATTGAMQYYAIGEQPNSPSEKALFVWPFADSDEPLDFTYQRRPRELQYSGRDAADTAGTITVTEDSNAVSGLNTTFDSGMVGAVLLIGRDGASLPTGRYGLNRFSEQIRIRSVASGTAMTLAANASATRSAVKYVVTDPVEIEACAQNAFLRYMEMHLARLRNLDKRNDYIAWAEKALRDAMAASYPFRYDPMQGSGLPWPPSGTVDWNASTGE